jgi:hypothetical protein
MGRAGVSWSVIAELRRSADTHLCVSIQYWLCPKDVPRSRGGYRRLSAAGVDDWCGGEDEGGRKQQKKMGITDQHLRIAMVNPM